MPFGLRPEALGAKSERPGKPGPRVMLSVGIRSR
jgi:hypothetical protein